MAQRSVYSDPVGRATSEILGGPRGQHVAATHNDLRGALINPVVALGVGSGLVMVLATVLRQLCRTTNWASPGQFTYSCYSDIPTLISSSQMGSGLPPLLGGPAAGSQSPGINMMLWLVAAIRGSEVPRLSDYFDIGVIIITLLLVAATGAAMQLFAGRPWDAAMVALSPIHVAAALISFDMAMVTLVLWALVAFRAERYIAGGLLLGLAVVIVPQLVVVALALALVGFRERQIPGMLTAAGVTLAVVVVTFGVYAAANNEAFMAWWEHTTAAKAAYGSLWFVPQLVGVVPTQVLVTTGWVVGSLVALTAVMVFALSRWGRPDVATVTLLLLVAVLLFAPNLPVQASLWLLPWAVVVVRQWTFLLPWMLIEVFYATMTWQYIYAVSEPNKGAPGWVYATALVLRLVAWAAIAVAAWGAVSARSEAAGSGSASMVASPEMTGAVVGDDTAARRATCDGSTDARMLNGGLVVGEGGPGANPA